MAGPDLTVVTAGLDFDSAAVAVVSVAALWVVVEVVWRGAMMILVAVRGGVYENNAGVAYSGRQLDRMWRDMGAAEKDDWGFGSKADFLDMFQRVK